MRFPLHDALPPSAQPYARSRPPFFRGGGARANSRRHGDLGPECPYLRQLTTKAWRRGRRRPRLHQLCGREGYLTVAALQRLAGAAAERGVRVVPGGRLVMRAPCSSLTPSARRACSLRLPRALALRPTRLTFRKLGLIHDLLDDLAECFPDPTSTWVATRCRPRCMLEDASPRLCRIETSRLALRCSNGLAEALPSFVRGGASA